MVFFLIIVLLTMSNLVFAQSSDSSLKSTVVSIPGGEGGIGFDDMVYSSTLHKVLLPAGHTGKLYLIDSLSSTMTSIGGFSSSAEFQKGHKVGISSVDDGEGIIFVADHGRHELVAVDPVSGARLASVELAGDVDFVRYVGVNHEIWASEPDDKRIEVFKFKKGIIPGLNHPGFFGDQPVMPSRLTKIMFITVPGEPEGLAVDLTRGRAYTNIGQNAIAIGLDSHAIVTTWPNQCEKSRCNALDEKNGRLFIACAEGKAEAFDLNNGYKEISNLVTDPGADVISYNAKLSHLYFTSGKNATLSVLDVSDQGKLSLLGKAAAAQRSHCVVGDDQDNIWVCDPPHGQLLRYKDK